MKPNIACVVLLIALSGCRIPPSAPTLVDIENSEKGSAAYLKTLTEAQRKSYDDLKADWIKYLKNDPAAAKKNYARATLQSQTILGEMGYGTLFTGIVDKKTIAALSQYQKNKGIFNSGNVDPLTYFALDADEEVLNHRTVMTASYFFSSRDWNRYFSADGAWDYQNKEDTYIQSSTIQCDKSLRKCTQANGIEMSLFGMSSVQTNITDFTVTKWDDFVIVADYYDLPCEKDELEVVRDKQTVTMHMNSVDKDNASCKEFMGDATTLDAHLVGWDRIGQSREDVLNKKRASLFQFSESARKIIEEPQ